MTLDRSAHPPTEPVISTGVGRRFFPPSLPRRCRPTQRRNLSSIDRVSPNSLQRRSYYSVTKAPQIRPTRQAQLAHFQRIPKSCLIRAIPNKRALLLSTTYRLFLRALCRFPHLQSFVFNLLWTLLRKKRGVGGYGSEKN